MTRIFLQTAKVSDEFFQTWRYAKNFNSWIVTPIPLASSSLRGFSLDVNNDDFERHFLGSFVSKKI